MTLIHVNKLSKKNTERTVMKNKIADIRPCFEEKLRKHGWKFEDNSNATGLKLLARYSWILKLVAEIVKTKNIWQV